MTHTTPPEIFVLAGPNGAGKSTVAEHLLPDELGVGQFVNADLIAKGLTPHAPERSAFEAGRIMLRRIRELREQRATFAFETTLASRTFAPFLREARDAGYVVHLVYVSLESADLAVRRVRIRVERGGHDIPEVTVRRRYARSLRNFFEIYRQLTDDWTLWDNSGADVVPVASGRTGAAPVLVNHDRWRSLSAEA